VLTSAQSRYGNNCKHEARHGRELLSARYLLENRPLAYSARSIPFEATDRIFNKKRTSLGRDVD